MRPRPRRTTARAPAANLWEVFGRLFAAFGPAGWWPVTLVPGQEPAYRPGVYVPQTPEELHEIAFGAVLTQNTAWENVKKALVRLTATGIRTPRDVLALSLQELEPLVRSSGYFRQKARRLQALARYLSMPSLEGKETEALRDELLAISGVGLETADSILLYGFGRPIFVVDAYTRRLAVRLGIFAAEPRYEEVRLLFEGALVPSVPLFNEYHALIVRLSKDRCRTDPFCSGCPLEKICAAGKRRAPRPPGRRRGREPV